MIHPVQLFSYNAQLPLKSKGCHLPGSVATCLAVHYLLSRCSVCVCPTVHLTHSCTSFTPTLAHTLTIWLMVAITCPWTHCTLLFHHRSSRIRLFSMFVHYAITRDATTHFHPAFATNPYQCSCWPDVLLWHATTLSQFTRLLSMPWPWVALALHYTYHGGT